MKYTTLIIEVAHQRLFGSTAAGASGRLGVRLSPLDIDAAEAIQLAEEARRLLPPEAFVAIAAPHAALIDEPRLFVSDGEATAARATQWRNALREGEALLFISARRLGRAGGLEDTLEALDEEALRSVALELAARDGALPAAALRGLRSADVLTRVPVRAVCAFLAATANKGLAAVGDALPLLNLARDTRIAEETEARITHNARWVRAATSGTGRQSIALTDLGLSVRQALRDAVDLADDARLERLRSTDLGVLSLSELTRDQQRTTRASKNTPSLTSLAQAADRGSPKPPRPATPVSRRAKDTGAAAPSPQRRPTARGPAPIKPSPGHQATEGDASDGWRSSPPPVDRELREGPADAPDGEPSQIAPLINREGVDTLSSHAGDAPPQHEAHEAASPDEPDEPLPTHDVPQAASPGEPDEPLPTHDVPQTASPGEPNEPLPTPPLTPDPPTPWGAVPPDATDEPTIEHAAPPPRHDAAPPASTEPAAAVPPPPRRAKRREPGPWTPELHAAALGVPQTPPSGLLAMLRASLAGDGLGLLWRVSTRVETVLEQIPKGLLPATTTGDRAQDLSGFPAWSAARASLLELLDDDPAPGLLGTPYSALGGRAAAAAARALVAAGKSLLSEAASRGPDAMWDALRLETLTVTSARGEEIVCLSPLHPVLLTQLVQRLDGLAVAAAARPLAQRLRAQHIDRPPLVPSLWEGELIDALPWMPSPRWAPCYGALVTAHTTVATAAQAVARAMLHLRPHARSCLQVIAADDAQEVIDGLAPLLDEDMYGAVVVHTRHAVEVPDNDEPGRDVQIEPLTEESPGHLIVRRARPADSPSAPPAGMETWTPHPWRSATAGAQRLATLPTAGRATWTLVVGERLTSPPPKGTFVLARGYMLDEEIVVLGSDVRPICAPLEPVFDVAGLADPRPKEQERRAKELARLNAGLLTLGASPGIDPSAALAEAVARGELSDAAAFGHLSPRAVATLLGPHSGSVTLGGDAFADRVELTLVVSDTSRPASAWAPAPLQRALEVLQLADDPALGDAVRALLRHAFEDGTEAGAEVANAIQRGKRLKLRLIALGSVEEAPLQLGAGTQAQVRGAVKELGRVIHG